MVQVSGTNYVELGSPIRLICNATGHHRAPDDIDWYRQGLMIESNSRAGVAVSKKTTQRVLMSMLVIDSSRMTDAGEYTCQMSTGEAASIDVHIVNGQPLLHSPSRSLLLVSQYFSAEELLVLVLTYLTFVLSLPVQHRSKTSCLDSALSEVRCRAVTVHALKLYVS